MATLETSVGSIRRRGLQRLGGAYFWLVAFSVVACARPQDWISGLSVVPLAKITGLLALLAFVFSLPQIRWPLPLEVNYLILLGIDLFVTVPMSPIWKGGALQGALGFAKIVLVVIVLVSAVDTAKRLRRLVFIQAASVAAIAAVAVWNEHLRGGRLEGIIGGNYSNANDLALAIVISIPLCLVLLFLSTSSLWKVAWILAIQVMMYAIFLTASRGGFIALIVVMAVSLWEFAIRGRRRYLWALTILVGVVVGLSSGAKLEQRLKGIVDPSGDVASYASAQQRQQVFWRSLEVTLEHPLFGVGPGNFEMLSGNWHLTHNAFTQMSSEGGIPAFVLYVLILYRGFKNVRAIKRLAKVQRDSALLARAFHASLAGYIVGSLFASTGYQLFPYYLVAYTTALFCIAKKSVPCSKEQVSVSQSLHGKDIYTDGALPVSSYTF